MDTNYYKSKNITLLNNLIDKYNLQLRLDDFGMGTEVYYKSELVGYWFQWEKGKEDATMEMGIYKIANKLTGTVYIGSTGDLKSRIRCHKKELRENRHENNYLQNSWNKCGEDAFSFEILEYVNECSELLMKEEYYINHYREIKGVYNINSAFKGSKRSYTNLKKRQSNKPSIEYYANVLNEEFNDLFTSMKLKIKEKVYFEKEKVDNYFLENIQNSDILNDERIQKILHKLYSLNGLSVISPEKYKSSLSKFKIDYNGTNKILVGTEMSKKLFKTSY